MTINKKVLLCVAITGIVVCIACSALHIFLNYDSIITEILGCVSTVVSIVLSVIAMISSSNTEKKTAETLEQIVKRNEALVNKINSDLIRINFDDRNIEDLINHSTLQK